METREFYTAERDRIRAAHMKPREVRPQTSARGVHHVALISSDVEATVRFYQDLLEFPLTDMFENRDYQGSTHFFFDIGNGNALAFFDLPGLDIGPYAEVLGGLHHLACRGQIHTSLTAVDMLPSGAGARAEMGAALRQFFGANVPA